jgi:hypothetical protein
VSCPVHHTLTLAPEITLQLRAASLVGASGSPGPSAIASMSQLSAPTGSEARSVRLPAACQSA